jgi:Tfp pilus assembly protein PilF
MTKRTRKSRVRPQEIPSGRGERRQVSRRQWWSYGFIALAASLAFLPALANDFTNWDDNVNLTDNPFLIPLSWWGFKQLWLAPYENLYVPLFYVSYYLDLLITGDPPNPFVTHLINIVLHALTAVLVATLTRRLWPQVDLAVASSRLHERDFYFAWLGGALIFAIHPIQCEVVAWATGRKDLVAAIFALAAWLSWTHRENATPTQRRRYLWASFGLFIAALLAKPAAVALPLALFVTDWFRAPNSWRTLARTYLPWFVLGALWSLLIAGTQEVSPQARAVLLPWWARPFVASDALSFYVRKLVWPLELAACYGLTPLEASRHTWFWFSLPVVAAVFVALWRWRSVWGWAAAVFVAFVAPVLGLIPFAYQRYSTVADRYVYLSLIGVSMAVSAAMGRSLQRKPQWRSLIIGVAAAVALALMALSWRQCGFWKNSITLWEHTIKVAPRSAVAHANLAAVYALANRNDDAMQANKRAIELDPLQERAHSNLGLLLLWRDETTAALEHLRRAIEIRPTFAAPYAHIGDCFIRQGRWQDAAEAYRQALDRDPRNTQAIIGLAYSYYRRGRFAEAEQTLRDGLLLRPTSPALWLNYGHLLADTGRKQEAIEMYRRVLALDPTNADAAQRLNSLVRPMERPAAPTASPGARHGRE